MWHVYPLKNLPLIYQSSIADETNKCVQTRLLSDVMWIQQLRASNCYTTRLISVNQSSLIYPAQAGGNAKAEKTPTGTNKAEVVLCQI